MWCPTDFVDGHRFQVKTTISLAYVFHPNMVEIQDSVIQQSPSCAICTEDFTASGAGVGVEPIMVCLALRCAMTGDQSLDSSLAHTQCQLQTIRQIKPCSIKRCN